MNFGMIFLCLAIGGLVGFEFGKYFIGKKVSRLFEDLAEKLKKEAEEARKKQEDTKSKIKQLTDDILQDLEKMKRERAQSSQMPDKETVDRIYEMEPTREDDVK